MDWSSSSEVMETLESALHGVPAKPTGAERRAQAHKHGDGAGDGGDGRDGGGSAEEEDEDDDGDEGDPDIVEEVFSLVYEAGEKLYASLLHWAPWKPDPSPCNLSAASPSPGLSSSVLGGRSAREIELSERVAVSSSSMAWEKPGTAKESFTDQRSEKPLRM